MDHNERYNANWRRYTSEYIANPCPETLRKMNIAKRFARNTREFKLAQRIALQPYICLPLDYQAKISQEVYYNAGNMNF
jgi:hypothetical protein